MLAYDSTSCKMDVTFDDGEAVTLYLIQAGDAQPEPSILALGPVDRVWVHESLECVVIRHVDLDPEVLRYFPTGLGYLYPPAMLSAVLSHQCRMRAHERYTSLDLPGWDDKKFMALYREEQEVAGFYIRCRYCEDSPPGDVCDHCGSTRLNRESLQ